MYFILKKDAEIIRTAVERSIEVNCVTEELNRANPKSASDVGDWIADYISMR